MGTKGILINHSKGNDGGRVEVRLGGTTGRLIAEFSLAHTNGWHKYQTAHVGLLVDDVEGVHDVTFFFKDADGVLDLAWFELTDFSDRSGLYPNIAATAYSTQSGMRFNDEYNMINVDNGNFITYSSL